MSYMISIPEIENPFKEKNFEGMSFEEIHEEFSDALRSPMIKHISGGIGKFLHGEEYPLLNLTIIFTKVL